MLDKLTDEQKDRLADLCNQIDYLFEEDMVMTGKEYDEWKASKLYKGIESVMYELGRWC